MLGSNKNRIVEGRFGKSRGEFGIDKFHKKGIRKKGCHGVRFNIREVIGTARKSIRSSKLGSRDVVKF